MLDVGCRLGAVLYGASAFSRASAIAGIEINSDFVQESSERAGFTQLQLLNTIQKSIGYCDSAKKPKMYHFNTSNLLQHKKIPFVIGSFCDQEMSL